MSQGNQSVANNNGATVRAAINTEFGALYSNSSGSSAPATTVAYMFWVDTTNNLLKQRNSANTAWITLGSWDQTNNIFEPPIGGGSGTLSSSATVDLGSIAPSYITVSGTTGVTSFGSSMLPGQSKIVVASGAWTLTYNATSMIIPGQANITFAVGDWMLVTCIAAGNYRVIPQLISGFSLGNSTIQRGGFRNGIINGGMQVWQKGTGSYTLTNAPSYGSITNWGLPDRWAAWMVGTAAGTAQQNTSVPTGLGFRYSLRIGRNVGSALTGAIVIYHAFTTDNSIPFQGKTITFSYYAKAGANFSGAGSNLGLTLYTGTGTDQSTATLGAWTGSVAQIAASDTLTTSWQRFTHTVALPAGATQIGFSFAYSGVGTAGADDNFYITGIQHEASQFATPFEFRNFETERLMCLPYWRKSFPYATTPAQNAGTSSAFGFISSGAGSFGTAVPLSPPMRAAPNNVFTYNPAAANANWQDITNTAARTFAGGAADIHQIYLYGASGVAGADNRLHYVVDSEL